MDFFQIQKERMKELEERRDSFQDCANMLMSELEKRLAFPWEAQVMYTSDRDWIPRDGFRGWTARLYVPSNPLFYDLVLDRITEENFTYYLNHAIQQLRLHDINIDAITVEE